MKIAIEIELGNEAMQSTNDVLTALIQSLNKHDRDGGELELGDAAYLRDRNGNTVGRWDVLSGEATASATLVAALAQAAVTWADPSPIIAELEKACPNPAKPWGEIIDDMLAERAASR